MTGTLLFVVVASASTGPRHCKRTASQVANDLVACYSARDENCVHALRTPRFQTAMPLDKERSSIDSLLATGGRLASTELESGDDSGCQGIFRVKAERWHWRIAIDLDTEGRIAGLLIESVEPPLERNSIPLGLPFRGEWYVFWGGSTQESNGPHVKVPIQRRAADLCRVDAQGSTHRGDGSQRSDYYAYGQEVLAVADGVVTSAVDGVYENEPGEQNTSFVPGNVVVVRHSDKLYSQYAHLQPGTLRVHLGSVIRKGDVLGLCGNSGNSSEPHLHFQLQDSPRFDRGFGVEPVFAKVKLTREGRSFETTDYTFQKGDRLLPERQEEHLPILRPLKTESCRARRCS